MAMTLLSRAGLSKPRPERSLEAARDVGADGFCLKKRYFEKRFYTQNILHSKSWVCKDLVQRDVGTDQFCLQMDILGNKFIQKLDNNQDH